jgi:diacylglycerol kinase (ATP)
MISRTLRSLSYSLEGLAYAIRTERNLKLVLLVFVLILCMSAYLQITPTEWAMILLAGGINIAIELINTAIERFVDAFENHAQKKGDPDSTPVTTGHRRTHYNLMKATKDVAGAAALIAGTIGLIVVGIVFWPYLS